jgi:glycosyltransferase involved in cell wall biosynthesis
VTEEEKQDLLRRCRCFAMPSRNEGFGLVYLEAMRLGRPCLVSDCDAGREIVCQNSGILKLDYIDSWPVIISNYLSMVCRKTNRYSRDHYNGFYTSSCFLERFVTLI